MAILFDSGSSEYLQVEQAVVTALPFTMACFFYAIDATNGHPLLWVGDKDVGTYYSALYARGDVAGDPLRAYCHDYASTRATADTSTSYSANTWHHACGVFGVGGNNMHAFLDGAGKVSVTAPTVSNHDRTSIGALRDSSPYYGGGSRRIALAGFWNVALSDEDVAMLPYVWPYEVKPANLVGYYPMNVVAMIHDLIGGYDMTAYNAPVTAEHPPVATLGGPIYVEYEVAAPPAGVVIFRRRRM